MLLSFNSFGSIVFVQLLEYGAARASDLMDGHDGRDEDDKDGVVVGENEDDKDGFVVGENHNLHAN